MLLLTIVSGNKWSLLLLVWLLVTGLRFAAGQVAGRGEGLRGVTLAYPKKIVFRCLHKATQAVYSKNPTLEAFFFEKYGFAPLVFSEYTDFV